MKINMMLDPGTHRLAKYAATLFSLSMLLDLSQPLQAADSIHPENVTPQDRQSDAPSWELGTIFRATIKGTITHARVFSLAEESGDHEVRIWRNSDNTLLAGPITVNFGGDESWLNLDIPDVQIDANVDYTISISTTAEGWYPANGGYFNSAGTSGEFLSYPQTAGVFSDTLGNRPTGSFGDASYLRDIVFEPDLSGTLMRVLGNGVEISDGATNASLANATRILGKGVNSGTRDQIYTISNRGQTALQLTGEPRVKISGPAAADFVVTEQPPATVAGGGTGTFTVRFDPSSIGLHEATITIDHADSPDNSFDFRIEALGLGGGAGVLGNDSEGIFARNINDTEIHGNRFESPAAMRITEIRAKVLELAGTFKCAVYSDHEGAAATLLAASAEVVNATNGWNTFALSAPLDLVAGDAYWLVIWADAVGARVQADPVGQAFQAFYSYVDLGGEWPDPIALITPVGEGPRTYCIYAEGTALGTAPGPEADLRGKGKLIVSGDASPSVLDDTDFGNANVGTSGPEHEFNIESKGDAALDLAPASAVTITGPNASDFSVVTQPTSPVAPGASTRFTIRFTPSASGLRSATVTLANNDPDEAPYTFAVQGAGLMSGRESIWQDTKTGGDVNFDGTYYELGTIFRSSVAGKVTHLRVYSLASESGEHTARLWRNDEESIVGGPYTWEYGGTTGWISLDIPDVDIEADVEYTVSISTGTSPQRNYPNIAGDLAAEGSNGQHLFYPLDAGVFTDVREARPTQSFNHGNYLRDVWFVPEGTVVVDPIRIVEVSANSGTGSITVRWEGGTPQFQVEKASSVNGPYESLGTPRADRIYVEPDAVRNAGQSFYRIRQL